MPVPPSPPPTPPPPSPPQASDPPSSKLPPQAQYSLVDIGTLGGDVTPHAINDHDDIAGTSKLSGQSGGGHAFLYLRECGCMQDLALASRELSHAWAVDDHDLVAMDSDPAPGEPYGPAVLWTDGGRVELPSTDPTVNEYGTAYAINTRGIVVGSAWSTAGSAHATLWTPHAGKYIATDMGTFGGSFSRALSVNDRADAVGTADTGQTGNNCQPDAAGGSRDHAFLYSHGALQDLGTLSPVMDDSDANGINNADDVVGSSAVGGCTNNPLGLTHAFLWRKGVMQDLGTLAGGDYQSSAEAINDGGNGGDGGGNGNSGDHAQIVGYSEINAQHVRHAFLDIDGKMLDLNFLIDPNDPLRPYVTLWDATAINCAGDIAAWGWDSRDASHQHGYLVLREGPGRPQC
jgi:probable HAF family extracellular repeat protein